MGLSVYGLDDVINFIEDMEVLPYDEEQMLKKGGKTLYEYAKEYIKKNVHPISGLTYKNIKGTFKRSNMIYNLKFNSVDSTYVLWGSSKNDNRYVGSDEKIIDDSLDEVVKEIEEELAKLKKID